MSRKQNLVYIINSLNIGGAEVGMCRLLQGLDRNKYNIVIVSLNGFNGKMIEKIPSWVRVIDLEITEVGYPSEILEFLHLLRSADIIVGSLFHSAMLARVAGLLNSTATVGTWRHAEQFKTGFRRQMFKYTSSLNDVVLADSEPVAETLRGKLGLNKDRIHPTPIAGINLDDYSKVNHAEKNNMTVGTIGRLSGPKNHFMVLDLADRLCSVNFSFEIAGSGELHEELLAEIENRELSNVTLHGNINDIPQFLSTLDIYLQPSLQEGLCITVLEAMAAGLPVVGSDVGGIGRNVEHGESGFLYEPTDVEGFASAIETLSKNPRLREQFGERGREIVAKGFTQDVLVSEFEKAVCID